MALLVEKASRNFITIYEKWSVVEALLGSGMTIAEYCREREKYAPWLPPPIWGNVLPPLY